MKNCKDNDILITGIGITSSIGQGKKEFISSLIKGKHNFSVMQREGRQKETNFIGAEIPNLSYLERFPRKVLRTISLSSKVALVTLDEAWNEARLDEVDPTKIGIIFGGNNFQQRELIQVNERYKEKLNCITPIYGLSFMDSDICGLCTEQFGIKGAAFTVGAASASGQVAIIQAANMIKAGQVDVGIVVGTLMDISYIECQAFRNLGAMGTDKYENNPELACRPFDKDRDGFIYGESCGVIVLERGDSVSSRNVGAYAKIRGCSMVMDGNRNPNPSYEGEVKVIKNVLEQSNLLPSQIKYVNPHGTGSLIGDEIELKAIKECNLSHSYINATKSIIGHGLTAAGTVETIATILQMKESCLHPTRNLENPIDTQFNWVTNKPISTDIDYALSLSFGFGGVNTAICLENYLDNRGGEI